MINILENFAGIDAGAATDQISNRHVIDGRNIIEDPVRQNAFKPRTASKPYLYERFNGPMLQVAQWVGTDGNMYFGHQYNDPAETNMQLRRNEQKRRLFGAVNPFTVDGTFGEDLNTGKYFYAIQTGSSDGANFAPDTAYDTWGRIGPDYDYGQDVEAYDYSDYNYADTYVDYDTYTDLQEYLGDTALTIGLAYRENAIDSPIHCPLVTVPCVGGGAAYVVQSIVPISLPSSVFDDKVFPYFTISGDLANDVAWRSGMILCNLTVDLVKI